MVAGDRGMGTIFDTSSKAEDAGKVAKELKRRGEVVKLAMIRSCYGDGAAADDYYQTAVIYGSVLVSMFLQSEQSSSVLKEIISDLLFHVSTSPSDLSTIYQPATYRILGEKYCSQSFL